MAPFRMIQVGTGGRGIYWCRQALPPNIEDGLINVVAAVDINPNVLENACEYLGLSEEKCYTDIVRAFDENEADFCTIVVPPAFHEEVVDIALAHEMHILSEKPIADTLMASCRIAKKVRDKGVKMGVTMSHRFDQDKTTLREELRSGRHGELDYLVCRFTCECRNFGGWGARFRHEMLDPLMIEGSVHHLDILADLAGSKCDTIYAQTWNPRWGEFGGDSQGLVMMQMENGTRAFYEGAKTNAVALNSWAQEYVRAECEGATLALNQREIECFPYDLSESLVRIKTRAKRHISEGEGQKVPLLEQRKWKDTWLVEKFVNWLNGGEPMETNLEDNLQSVALIFSAIESSRTGKPVKVQAFLNQARQEVENAD